MTSDATRLLLRARDGSDEALNELLGVVQGELRMLARKHLARERADHTLQPTALVNEVYLKLIDQRERDWVDRGHFLSIASTAMRRILLEHARARVADKRGGGACRVTFFDVPSVLDDSPECTLALDTALEEFAQFDPRNAKIVELSWFGGLSHEEIAALLEVSVRTVERGWRVSRAWLRQRLED